MFGRLVSAFVFFILFYMLYQALAARTSVLPPELPNLIALPFFLLLAFWVVLGGLGAGGGKMFSTAFGGIFGGACNIFSLVFVILFQKLLALFGWVLKGVFLMAYIVGLRGYIRIINAGSLGYAHFSLMAAVGAIALGIRYYDRLPPAYAAVLPADSALWARMLGVLAVFGFLLSLLFFPAFWREGWRRFRQGLMGVECTGKVRRVTRVRNEWHPLFSPERSFVVYDHVYIIELDDEFSHLVGNGNSCTVTARKKIIDKELPDLHENEYVWLAGVRGLDRSIKVRSLKCLDTGFKII